MFTWNVKDMVLLNQKSGVFFGKEKIYNCESELTREEKIAFVDSMQDGKLSYILSLAEKFKKDKESLPQDSWGYVKTVSLKAWLRRNDDRKLVDDKYSYGKINFLNSRFIWCVNTKHTYDTYDDYVDEIFHRQLKKCEEMEKKYFLEHDEYSILKKKFRNRKYDTTFGVRVGEWSSGKICVVDENDNEREITIDELKELLAKYDELDKLVEKLTAETHIVY